MPAGTEMEWMVAHRDRNWILSGVMDKHVCSQKKKSPEEWLVKKYDSKMSSPKGSAVLKGIALELDNLGLNFFCSI